MRTPKNPKNEYVMCLLTYDIKQKLLDLADLEATSRSAIIRKAILEYHAKHGTPEPSLYPPGYVAPAARTSTPDKDGPVESVF